MKKTLIAVAALSAMAASAMAANVTVYGVVDTGLHYQHLSDKFTAGDESASTSSNKFNMAAGQNSGNRFGFKGTEDLGNEVTVGFKLENGFSSDTGKLGQSSRLFGREANLYVTSGFGTLSFARVGALSSGTGSYNLANYTPFGTGWGDTSGAKANFWLGDRDRMDNTITYVSPSLAGLKVYAQYSFDRDGDEAAGNERQNDRYAGLGVSYNQGAFSAALVVDTVMYNYAATNHKDSLGVTLGASYDFGVVKLLGQAQYGKHENAMGFKTSALNQGTKPGTTASTADYFAVTSDRGWEGYAITLGVTAPVAAGKVFFQASYLDADTGNFSDMAFNFAAKNSTSEDIESFAGKFDAKNWGLAVGYTYPFSKRTFVYTYASYNQLKLKLSGTNSDGESIEGGTKKTKQTEIGFGLVHNF